MSTLEDFVTVTITTTSQTPTQVGFGTPMVAMYHALYTDRMREYSKLSDAVADGIVSTGVTAGGYAALAKTFSQNPRPKTCKVGRLSAPSTQTISLTPTSTVVGDVYKLTIGLLGAASAQVTYTNDASPTILEACNALKTAIDALGYAITVTVVSSDHLTIAINVPGKLFDITAWTSNLTLLDATTADSGLSADLDLILAADSDFYGFSLASNSKAEITIAAAWAETKVKLYFYNTSDTACGSSGSTTDVMYAMKALAYFRTAGIYNGSQLLSFAGAAWFAEEAPFPPGSSTYALKNLKAVTIDSALTTTQESAIKAKNGNTFTSVSGVRVTNPGKSAGGEYIDIAVGRDWLHARMQERVFGALTGVRKVPFTDTGVSLIKSEVKAQLQDGIRSTFLAEDPAPIVLAPLVKDVSAANRANRLLPDVTFSATLAGAIQAVTISGTISV